MATAAPPSCVLSATTSFSPISLVSSAGEEEYFLSCAFLVNRAFYVFSEVIFSRKLDVLIKFRLACS